MTNDKQAILVILSRILDYPDQLFFEEQSLIVSFIQEYISTEDSQKEVVKRISPLYELSLKELQELYVETFDYKDNTNLYLTAHELGDSRKRGVALIELQKQIHEAGYECVTKELADYIPMLLELLAVVPEEEKISNLSARLAYAMDRILTNLPNSNPYKKVMELGMIYVFETPELEKISRLEILREEADLNELPYPLMYR
ncbi:nitrate reductase molybdenum cofactor assembly chaperone [Bacillus sp. EB600]|uniref:nitrate reductase molybdenum cofactor assembly chaperone n=1 Tax=Bacillus sp. EB600 TaxID=2806345 RepID=UPI00210EBECA|nr:nitrate reductase molybdenum cofactor assembly chaperone [Bacillus sp. EB600]MCQ6280579.1 nitrate reductase molybdenum cofactor assembly chaperone [Bacillus sp. EB600]